MHVYKNVWRNQICRTNYRFFCSGCSSIVQSKSIERLCVAYRYSMLTFKMSFNLPVETAFDKKETNKERRYA